MVYFIFTTKTVAQMISFKVKKTMILTNIWISDSICIQYNFIKRNQNDFFYTRFTRYNKYLLNKNIIKSN